MYENSLSRGWGKKGPLMYFTIFLTGLPKDVSIQPIFKTQFSTWLLKRQISSKYSIVIIYQTSSYFTRYIVCNLMVCCSKLLKTIKI